MKTAQDPRHKNRIKRLKSLFAYSFQKTALSHNKSTDKDNGVDIENTALSNTEDIQDIIENLDELDSLIQDAAPEWPLEKINKIDLAILRLSLHEILYMDNIPTKVSIDEGVELAKEFGSENSPAFINGVLGTIIKKKGHENE